MTERVRTWLGAAGLSLMLGAGLASLAADVQACPSQEVEDVYFSDATYTVEVGWSLLTCNCGGRKHGGVVTPFRIRTVASCREF
jgi:hypothetical protein